MSQWLEYQENEAEASRAEERMEHAARVLGPETFLFDNPRQKVLYLRAMVAEILSEVTWGVR